METTATSEAPARALAMMIAAHCGIDARELQVLDEFDAFRRLNVSRQRFVELVRTCARDIGANLAEHSWLCSADEAYVDTLLDAVTNPELRLLICRLADAVIAAESAVTQGERLIYCHALTRWRISGEQGATVMLREPGP
jgi:hypothetical protein